MFSISYNKKSFDEILDNIVQCEFGIKKVFLTDRTGLTIANVSRFCYIPADDDAICAVTSAIYSASEDQGKDLDLGPLNIIMCEFTGGKIFAVSAGRGILTLIGDADINIGLIRFVLNRAKEQLRELLDDFFADVDFWDKRDEDKDLEDDDYILV